MKGRFLPYVAGFVLLAVSNVSVVADDQLGTKKGALRPRRVVAGTTSGQRRGVESDAGSVAHLQFLRQQGTRSTWGTALARIAIDDSLQADRTRSVERGAGLPVTQYDSVSAPVSFRFSIPIDTGSGNGFNVFDSIGDDYATPTGTSFLLEEFVFAGGVDNANEVLFFDFFDTNASFVNGFSVQLGAAGPLLWFITLANPFIVPGSGFMIMTSDDGSVLVDSSGVWLSADQVLVGSNDPNRMVVDFACVAGFLSPEPDIMAWAMLGTAVDCASDFTVTAPFGQSSSTCGAANDCALQPTEEHIYQVTIPNSGDWTFSLCGSSFDTFLFIGTTCCGAEIGSNDDFCDLQSEITVNISAGTYYVTVEGFDGCGGYDLDIFQPSLCGPACDKLNIECLNPSPQYDNGTFVGQLRQSPGGPGFCTAWIIAGQDCMFTNNHCSPQVGYVVAFNYQCDACAAGSCRPVQEFTVNQVIACNEAQDWCLFRVNGNVAATFGQAQIDPSFTPVNTEIYEIHHAEAQKKGYDQGVITGTNLPVGCPGSIPEHSASVIASQGASGSPVFRMDNDCVTAACNCGPPCSDGFILPMSTIWPNLQATLDSAGCSYQLCCVSNADCDDGNECTNDVCATGVCTNSDKPTGTSCDLDGQFCTADTCNGTGTCISGGDPCAGPDGDSDCSESCNEVLNNCTANDPNGSACPSDGQFCTGTESCQNGSCVGSGDPCADPANPVCDEKGDECVECLVNADCPDPDLPKCDVNTNTCVECLDVADCPGPDGDGDCSESCDLVTKTCTGNDFDGSACDDGTLCTENDMCDNGECVGTKLDSDGDGVPDCIDNCVCTANPSQCDTDGDGIGNHCDADLNNDGAVGIPDFNLFRDCFDSRLGDPNFDPDCDFNCDDAVGIPDFNIFRSGFGLPPGSQDCLDSKPEKTIAQMHDPLNGPLAVKNRVETPKRGSSSK